MKPKLYLLNGPLGAGKTTFLRQLLKAPGFEKARVIENEFASTSIDTQQLHDHQAEVKTIAGVCICCSTGDELVEVLVQLKESSEPVIIESTGVANSLKLIEKLAVGDVFEQYQLAQGIFVLDAAEVASGRDTLEQYTAELQGADMVLLSKVDLLSDNEHDVLIEKLEQLSVRQVKVVKNGVCNLDFLQSPSRMLEYFVSFDGELRNHDTGVNYTVIDMADIPLSPAAVETLWERLKGAYALRRMKGDVRDEQGVVWHIEATPAQCRVTEGEKGQTRQLVMIGGDARNITQSEVVKELGNATR